MHITHLLGFFHNFFCYIYTAAQNITLGKGYFTAIICRYFFLDSIAEIAAALGFSSSKVKSLLFRLRSSLREYLQKEGFEL